MKLRVITKICVAAAITCGVLFGVSVAPLIAAVAMAVFTLVCLFVCLLILIVGGFVWLFSGGKSNIFAPGIKIAEFGLNTYSYIPSITNFSFTYFTPIVGWIAFGVGVAGIILSIIALVTANKALPQNDAADAPEEAEAPTVELQQSVAVPERKTFKRKKKKTDRGVCIGALVACIVLAVLALIAVFVAARILATM